MGYKSRSLLGVINILNREIFLPHIQRPFVWEKAQMSRLFDSLMRGYPIQTFLFWKTKEEIKARKFMFLVEDNIDLHTLYDVQKSEKGVEKTFVLDGQQRLQTLCCIYTGAIKNQKTNLSEEAYFDLTASNVDPEIGQIFNLEFHNISANKTLPFFRIKNLLSIYEKKAPEDISDEINDALDTVLNDSGDAKKQREKTVRKNISQLRSILTEDVHFWIEELDGVANDYSNNTILEIFVRVNSGGTKLDASDLMFAAMKELSPSIEANLEEVAIQLNSSGLSFEIDTILKGILLVNNKGAVVDPKKFSGTEGANLVSIIDENWEERYNPAFAALRDFIFNDLKLDNHKVIRSYNSLIPIFEYLYQNNAASPANKSRLKAFFTSPNYLTGSVLKPMEF